MNDTEIDEFESYPYDPTEMYPESDAQLIKRAMFVSALIMLACCSVGLFGNVMSIFVFCNKSMKAPINVLLIALSAIDTALIALSIPVYIIPSLNTVINSRTLQSMYDFTSLYLYPFSMMTHSCSIWTFVLVSVERWLAVCRPLKRHKLLTCRKAKLTQTAVVLISILYNIVRFWEYQKSSDNLTIEQALRHDYVYFVGYYVLLYMATHFLGPFAAILVLNIFVVCSLRAVAKDKLRRISRSEKAQRKTTQMIVVITLMFASFTTPPFVINLIEVLNPRLFQGEYAAAAFIAMDVSNILVVVNSSSTFIIYLLYCQKYRRLFVYYSSKCFASRTQALRKWSEEKFFRKNTGTSLISLDEGCNNLSVLIEKRGRLSYV